MLLIGLRKNWPTRLSPRHDSGDDRGLRSKSGIRTASGLFIIGARGLKGNRFARLIGAENPRHNFRQDEISVLGAARPVLRQRIVGQRLNLQRDDALVHMLVNDRV